MYWRVTSPEMQIYIRVILIGSGEISNCQLEALLLRPFQVKLHLMFMTIILSALFRVRGAEGGYINI